MVADPSWTVPGAGRTVDRAATDLSAHYLEHLGRSWTTPAAGRVADRGRLREWRDGADGAGVLRSLGFDVSAIGVEPERPQHQPELRLDASRRAVARRWSGPARAWGSRSTATAIARCSSIIAGRIVDGDAVLLMAAIQLQARGPLAGRAVVATVMSNIGLEIALRERGIALVRTRGGRQVRDGGDGQARRRARRRAVGPHHLRRSPVHRRRHGDRAQRAADHGRDRQGSRRAGAALVTYPQVLVNVRVRREPTTCKVPAIADDDAAGRRAGRRPGTRADSLFGHRAAAADHARRQGQDRSARGRTRLPASVREHLACELTVDS